MKAMLCGCGRRLEAADDEGLVREALEHYRWEHAMAVIDGAEIRRIVEQGSYEQSTPAARGGATDEELWPGDMVDASNALSHTYEGYGGEQMWPANFGPR